MKHWGCFFFFVSIVGSLECFVVYPTIPYHGGAEAGIEDLSREVS